MEGKEMKVTEKATGFDYEVFDITYDNVGYPRFLIYKDGQWIRRSAKYFKPITRVEDAIISKSPSGVHKAFVKKLYNDTIVLHS